MRTVEAIPGSEQLFNLAKNLVNDPVALGHRTALEKREPHYAVNVDVSETVRGNRLLPWLS